jgi:hypothetical protein
MHPPEEVTDLSIPQFLIRDQNNESEITQMYKPARYPVAAYAPPAEAAEAVETEAPTRKARVAKATRKAAVGKAAKAPAKAKGKAKVAKPAKAKATRKPRTIDPAKLDQWGFRKGSIKSQAADLYARKKGATIHEVKEAVGSIQFNVLIELEKNGFKLDRTQEDGLGKRKATRYKLHPKK